MLKKLITLALCALTATTMSANIFDNYKSWKTPHGAYPFGEIHAEDYMPAFEKAMAEGLKEIDDIVSNPAEPTFENTIEAYERSGEMLGIVAGCFYNLTNSETNDTLQALEMELSPKMSEYSSTIRLNEALFQRIKAVYDKRESLKLKPHQMKLLEDIYESFANNGANLNAEQKNKYKELSARLSALTLAYGQNVLKATNAWTMLLEDESLLAGLNDDTKAILRLNAKAKGYESGWLLNLKPTTYGPVMQDLDNRDIRRELYMAYNSRCVGGEFDNTQNIIDIVNTRLEMAQLFEKSTYADKSLHKTMAETKENVYRMLDQMRDAYLPAAKEEVAEVAQFAHQNGLYAELMPWDFSYYSKRLKKAKYDISDDDLKPYFELEAVKKGVFGLAQKLYGIKFVENKNIPVYHPEVCAYDVFDEKGKFLAVYYADFHPRDGKRGGAWMNDFQPQYMLGRTDHRPHIVNVMNFTRPVEDENGKQVKPALLTYDEVRTFLHEFGHGLHGMLTRCQYSAQSGTNVPRDFVELPSQFNENFIDEKEFLDTFARHYETGAALPDSLLQKLHASQTYHAAYACVRQLSFGYLDMAWHTLDKPFVVPADLTTVEAVVKFGDRAMNQVAVLPSVAGTQMECAFTHIFAGGYAAGYYSYKWSEMLDADAFSVFKAAAAKKGGTIFDRKAAKRFRECILEKGSTENVADLYRRFRGGEPTINALLERDGIKAVVVK